MLRRDVLKKGLLVSLSLAGASFIPALAQDQENTVLSACGTTPNGDFQVLAVDGNGKLWHAMRYADTTWSVWGDPQPQIVNGPDLGRITAVSCSGTANGDLHIVVVANDKPWHTIRFADGNWQPFWGDLLSGIADVLSLVTDANCAGTSNDELQVLVETADGKLWHTIRFADGNWQPFWGDVFEACGNLNS
jgi:hypothetical protein